MTEQEKQHSQAATPVTPVREVRQWRVGTLSMGLLLVALGIVLLVGKFNPAWSLGSLLKFWPVILIVLGLEMVMLNILSSLRGCKFRFTYDVLSILLVFLILISSSVMVALESAGVLDFTHRALGGAERYGKAETVFTADESLRSLALRVEGSGETILRSYPGKEIKVSVLYLGIFSTQKEADAYAKEQYIGEERLENTLAVTIYPPTQGKLPRHEVRQEVTIFIPQELDVELDQQGGSIKIDLDELKSNWTVNHRSSQNLDISLGTMTAGRIAVQQADELRGNIDWDEIRNQDNPELPIEAVKSWGEGPYSLSICQDGGKTIIRTK